MKGSRFGQLHGARNAAFRKKDSGLDETEEIQRAWHVPARKVPLPGASSPQGTTEVCDVIGTCVYRNGSTYDGGWLKGQHHGAGTAVDKNGWKYNGEWVQGVPQGFGRAEYGVGTYQGEWRKGQRHGHGVWSSSAGEHYCGGWKAGVRNGQGKWSYKHYTYTGGWLDGEFSGHGEQAWGSYDNTGVGLGSYGTFVGEFKHNRWHGKGKVSSNSTTEYEGAFRHGLKSGFGTFRFGDQLVFEGLFEADHPLEPSKGFSQPEVCEMFAEDSCEGSEVLQLGVQKRLTQRALSNLEVSEIVELKDESSVGVVCLCCTSISRFFMSCCLQLVVSGPPATAPTEAAGRCSFSGRFGRCLRQDQLKAAAAQAISDWTVRKLLHGLGEWQIGASRLRAQKHCLRVAVAAFDKSAVRLRLPALQKWRTQAPLLRQKMAMRAQRAPELAPIASTPDSVKKLRGLGALQFDVT